MSALVQIATSEGSVLFEGDLSEAALEEIAIEDRVHDVVTTVDATFQSVASTVRQCVTDLRSGFDDLTTDQRYGGTLSGAELELGITVSAEGNVFVAKGTAGANLKIKLTWDFSGHSG
jgi:hypothetical protein